MEHHLALRAHRFRFWRMHAMPELNHAARPESDRSAGRSRPLLWTGAALVTLLVSLSLWLRDDNEQIALGGEGLTLPAVQGEARLEEPQSGVRVAQGHDHRESAREILAEYWGADWDAIEGALEADGANLDQPFELVPWEDVAQEFESVGEIDPDHANGLRESFLKWPGELSLEWLQDTYGGDKQLSSVDWGEIAAIAEPFNFTLYEGVEEMLFATDIAIQHEWGNGHFVKAPFSTKGVQRREGAAFYAIGRSHSSWGVGLRLFVEDYPEIPVMHQRLRKRQANRDGAIRAYVAGL